MRLNREAIARVCHAANRAYCYEIGDPVPPKWEDTDAEFKAGVIQGVENFLDFGNDDPEASHARWCEYKRKNGWSYGPVKDDYNKTHPNLVEYHKLPEAQKRKDYLFLGVILCLTEQI